MVDAIYPYFPLFNFNELYLKWKLDVSTFLWWYLIIGSFSQLSSLNPFEQIHSINIFHNFVFGEFFKSHPCSHGCRIKQGNEKDERKTMELNPSVYTHACTAVIKIIENFNHLLRANEPPNQKVVLNLFLFWIKEHFLLHNIKGFISQPSLHKFFAWEWP